MTTRDTHKIEQNVQMSTEQTSKKGIGRERRGESTGGGPLSGDVWGEEGLGGGWRIDKTSFSLHKKNL